MISNGEIFSILSVLSMLITSCGDNGSRMFTVLDSDESGISFQNTITETEDFNILDYLYFYNGAGVAVGDVNNDGLPDIFFAGNQVKNKLYLNKGDLDFEDITTEAGVSGESDWNTGAVMVDINADGWLDIYVCAVVGVRGLQGYNELFINNGDNTFSERSQEYGLDFDTYSSSVAFLDYDLDGDLDMYLLNHAIHTQESFGHADLRNRRTYETGDKLLRNDNGFFTDVSEQAGIYGGVNGYGLGIAVSDFNGDKYPDIFVGNDFHEDDYYYLNTGNGTFSEELRNYFGYTSRFSMGCDVADINKDGRPDLISLDMLPEDERVLKRSEGDEDYNIQKLRREQYGYHYQFSRNMLQINNGPNPYQEVGLLSGVSATDWSWSALFADFDLDGNQDLYVSNGIPKRPNDLDYIRFVSSEQIMGKMSTTKLVDQQALELMPSGATRDYIFKGSGGLAFEDQSESWLPDELTYSTATALADLDADGDLDVIINNLNGQSRILINNNSEGNYLKFMFDYSELNPAGIGTKVNVFTTAGLLSREFYYIRGFQASSEPVVHFGIPTDVTIDSINIQWPDGKIQRLREFQINEFNRIAYNPEPGNILKELLETRIFEKVENNLGINFTHNEDRYVDFDRQKLIPYKVSDRGPATALGDINNDGKTDIFFGGSKFISSKIYIQSGDSFKESLYSEIQNDSIREEVVAAIADFNGDQISDLLIGSGGADFFNEMEPLLDALYLQTETGYVTQDFPRNFHNTSVIATSDFDGDGDIDVFLGSQSVSADFGKIPNSYLLVNEKGKFTPIENDEISKCGMVTDAIWSDYNNDGKVDLIVVGEWMSPKFFMNDGKELVMEKILKQDLSGLWQEIIPFDIDGDGDEDYLLGNWGLNSKFQASIQDPMVMHYDDFDDNGSTETIISISKEGNLFPIEGLDGLASQMVGLRKKYTTYKDFAGQTTREIFDNVLADAEKRQVSTLESGFLRNDEGAFVFVPFEAELQLAPIMAFTKFDFSGDGKDEVLVAGNYFGVKPYHGRFGSFPGAIISGSGEVQMADNLGLELMNKSVRDLNVLSINNRDYLLITINNQPVQVYQILRSEI